MTPNRLSSLMVPVVVAVRSALRLAAAPALIACADQAPAEPTWVDDVAPILAAHCARCHGAPAIGGAPATFRLDRYDDSNGHPGGDPLASGRRVLGAAAMAEWIAERAADGSMPPRFPLAQHDRDVLTNWFDARPLPDDAEDGTRLPLRGAARPGNQPPRFTLTAAPDDDGDESDVGGLTLAYQLSDPDGDLVSGQLLAALPGGPGTPSAEPRVIGELHGGRGTLILDTALLPAGPLTLTALLDDGPGPRPRPAGQLAITPPAPAPPRLTLWAPEQGDYLAAAELPLSIELLAQDADTAQLAITVTLVDDRAAATPIASRTLTAASGTRQLVTLGAADLPAALTYRVIAEVSDGTATTSARSGRFRVARETTADTFQSIADDILAPYCLRCHASAARVPGLAIDLSSYRGTAERPGVYELRRRLYHRAVVAQNMPPGSARLAGGELPAAERERLSRWLLAGAPEVAIQPAIESAIEVAR